MPLFEIFSAESLANLSTYVGRFFPADISSIFLKKIGIGIIETLAISAIGTLVASFFAILLEVSLLENGATQPLKFGAIPPVTINPTPPLALCSK